MAAKAVGVDATTGETVTLENLDLEAGFEIVDIDNELEWMLTTKDDTPANYTVDFVGGRPDDR